MYRFMGLFGIAFLLGVAFLMSENKKKIRIQTILFGIGMQFLVGLFVLKTEAGKWFFKVFLGDIVIGSLLRATDYGAQFIFGGLMKEYSFALSILPTIVFFSSFFAVLYYFGILQMIVKVFAFVLKRLLGTSGAESLSTAANVMMGQTEAPLMIKPFVEKMTHSELMCIMTGGMATVAGGVLAAYVSMGVDAGSLIAASVMNAPAAIVIAKIMVPETSKPLTSEIKSVKVEVTDRNALEAASRGAGEGLFLALNVAAMLLAFVAFVYFINSILGIIGLSLQQLLGYIFRPIAFLLGVPWAEAGQVGTFLGERTAINEFVAYQHLGSVMKESAALKAISADTFTGSIPFIGPTLESAVSVLSKRAATIATYALCGFANFSSIAIQMGGIGGLAPSRRGEIASLGFRSMMAGTMATFLTASVAGIMM